MGSDRSDARRCEPVRILVIGSGAREHALLLALRKDPQVDYVAIAPGNAGTAAVAEQFTVDITSAEAVTDLVARVEADLVVIGPEIPLVAGVADAIRAAGIACFGPSKEAARIEGSKGLRQGCDGRRRCPDCRQRDGRQRGRSGFRAGPVWAVRRAAGLGGQDDGLAAGKAWWSPAIGRQPARMPPPC